MQPGSHSTFLSLPAELRLEIYEWLWQPHPICGTANYSSRLKSSTIPSSQDLSLLLTCRLVHIEARNIAFSRHTFVMTRRRKDCEVSTAPGSLAPHPSSLIHALIIPAWKPFNSRIPAEQGHDGHFLRYVFGLRNFTKLAHQLPSLQYATIVLPPDCLTTDTWTASSSQMSRKLIRSYRAQFAFRWRIVESFAAKLETSEFEERYGITGFERISWSEGKGYRISIRVDRENGEKQRQCELRVCAMDVG